MASPFRSGASYSFGGPLTPAVKYIIGATVGMGLLQILAPAVTEALSLYPPDVLGSLQVWRLVTYLFLHGGFLHLLFNMLAVFMFGCELERMWGTRSFLRFYLVCGVGAGFFTFLPIGFFNQVPHIGASGAIYAILMAYGLYFPNRVIYMNLLFIFFFPIQVKYVVMIYGLLALYGSLEGASGGVSHLAHLGGLAVGYFYLRLGLNRLALGTGMQGAYRRWRMKRLRKKFEQYYQKRSGGPDGPTYTVH